MRKSRKTTHIKKVPKKANSVRFKAIPVDTQKPKPQDIVVKDSQGINWTKHTVDWIEWKIV